MLDRRRTKVAKLLIHTGGSQMHFCPSQGKANQINMKTTLSFLALASLPVAPASAMGDKIELSFYFPLVPGVKPALQDTLDSIIDDFNMSNNGNIEVTAVYAGSYVETSAKVEELILAGTPPDVTVLNVNAMVPFSNKGYIIGLNEYVEASSEEGTSSFLDQYYGPMFDSEKMGDELYGIPFMRSTPILYVNKDMLDAAGVQVPTTWEELVSAAASLTTDDVAGLGIPDTWDDWIFGAFSRQAGSQLIENDWTTPTFNSEGNVEALSTWVELANAGSIPVPLTPWSTSIADFTAGKFAMLYWTTGGMSAVKADAPFSWDAVFCPAGPAGFGVEQGGGDLHIMADITQERKDAAWVFITYLTNPENAAKWSAASGYIAVNKQAYDTPLMQETVAETPQYLVARDQIVYGYPQMMSENIDAVREIVKSNLEAAVDGSKTVEQALNDGQAGMIEAIPGAAPTEETPADITTEDGGGVTVEDINDEEGGVDIETNGDETTVTMGDDAKDTDDPSSANHVDIYMHLKSFALMALVLAAMSI